jgi:hypothetical protein
MVFDGPRSSSVRKKREVCEKNKEQAIKKADPKTGL